MHVRDGVNTEMSRSRTLRHGGTLWETTYPPIDTAGPSPRSKHAQVTFAPMAMVNASVERLSQRARDDAAAYRSHLHLVPPTGRILVRQPSANLSAMVKRLKLVQRRYNYTAAMGNSWQVAGEPCALERLGTSPSAFDGREIETVCEIGFNGATRHRSRSATSGLSRRLVSLALLACCCSLTRRPFDGCLRSWPQRLCASDA